jgi:hypothetical protein
MGRRSTPPTGTSYRREDRGWTEVVNEASRQLERQRQEQQRLLEQRELERTARAAEWEAQRRQEAARLRQDPENAERRRNAELAAAEEARRRVAEEAAAEVRRQRAAEEAEQRRQNEQAAAEAARRRTIEEAERRRAAAEEAQRRAAEEAERRRRERLRPCVIYLEDSDVALMAQTPCSHWSCQTCLRGEMRSRCR